MIYLLIGSFLYVMALIEGITFSKRISALGATLAFILMIVLASSRNGVGTDWEAYLNFYRSPQEAYGVEPGYRFFNSLFSDLGVHYNLFLFFINCTCGILIIFFLRYLGVFCVSAAIIYYSDLFLYYNLSGVRQAIATALTCFAFRYACSRHPTKFLSLIAIAATFHVSALIASLIYFIPRDKMNWYLYAIVCAVGLIFYSYLDPIAAWITENSLKNATYYVSHIQKYENIQESYFIGLAKRSIVLIVAAACWRRLSLMPHSRYVLNIYISGLLIYLFTYLTSADIAVRLGSYFMIFDMVIFSAAIWSQPKVLGRLCLIAIIVFMSAYKLTAYADDPYYKYSIFFQL